MAHGISCKMSHQHEKYVHHHQLYIEVVLITVDPNFYYYCLNCWLIGF